MRGREKFNKYKKPISTLVSVARKFPERTLLKAFEKRRYTRGLFGLGIRYVLLKALAKDCGDNVAIMPGAYILHPQNISLGNNVSIHPMCYIECGEGVGSVVIGDDVSIAHGVTIMATSHRYTDDSVSIKDQGLDSKETVIGSNVWIGAKASILAGVTISDGCVIGANSVVTKDTDFKSVYVGSPAKKIKER